MEQHCGVDSERVTPACEINDGVDYVPTRASVLFGHHFSSIAGAGPIVGPLFGSTNQLLAALALFLVDSEVRPTAAGIPGASKGGLTHYLRAIN